MSPCNNKHSVKTDIYYIANFDKNLFVFVYIIRKMDFYSFLPVLAIRLGAKNRVYFCRESILLSTELLRYKVT